MNRDNIAPFAPRRWTTRDDRLRQTRQSAEATRATIPTLSTTAVAVRGNPKSRQAHSDRLLAELTRIIHGQALWPPRQAQILSVPPPHGMELLRLHAQAGRIIEQNPDRIAHSEVARALEQNLSLAVAKCLGGDRLQPDSVTRGARTAMLAQLEAVIVENPHRLPGVCEICERVGVSEPTLQAVCDTVLGMPIEQYQRLRRLKLVRADLVRSAEPSSAADLARRYGFTSAQDFVVEYVRAFGEFPLTEGQPATDHV